MKWEDYKKNSAKIGVGIYFGSNALIIGQQFIENGFDIIGIPYDLIAAGIFLIGNFFMSQNTNKGMAVGMGFAALAYGVLAYKNFMNLKPLSGLGCLVSAGAGLWAMDKSIKEMNKTENFIENHGEDRQKNLFHDYPLLEAMGGEMGVNTIFSISHFMENQEFYGWLGVLWVLSALNIGISKQKDEKPQNPTPPYTPS